MILRLGRGFVLLVRQDGGVGRGERGTEGEEMRGILDCVCVGPEAWCGVL